MLSPHEEEALKGAKGTIDRSKPIIVFENWRETSTPHVTLGPFRILEQLEYKFFQIAWIAESRAGLYGYSGSPKDANQQSLRVALVPVFPEQRFLLEDQINILAIHNERLDSILSAFIELQHTN